MSMVLGGLDVIGDDDEGVAVIGAGGRLAHRAHSVRVPTPHWMRGTTTQGVSRPQEELDFLPFAPANLTGETPTGFLLGTPQRPFRGERLILDAVRENGTDAKPSVVIDPAIFVGAVQVGADQGGVPISTFQATAFGVRLSIPASGQGTKIRIYVRSIVVLAEGQTITVTATWIGRAMR